MTSTRGGGMKNSEPLKADWNGRHRKVAFDLVPGPGARTSRTKIMRQLPYPGPGGPTVWASDEGVLSG